MRSVAIAVVLFSSAASADGQRLERVIMPPDPNGPREVTVHYRGDHVHEIRDGNNLLEEWTFDGSERPIRASRGDFAREWTEYAVATPLATRMIWQHKTTRIAYDLKPTTGGGLALVDPSGVQTIYGVRDGRVVSIERAGLTWTFTYDAGALASLTYPNGLQVTATYDRKTRELIHWRVLGAPGANGDRRLLRHWRFHYQTNGVVTMHDTTNDRETLYQHGQAGLIAETTFDNVSRPVARAMAYAQVIRYYPSGDRAELDHGDRSRFVRRFDYRDSRNITALVDDHDSPTSPPQPRTVLALGSDLDGNINQTNPSEPLNPNLAGTRYRYDENRRLLSVVDSVRHVNIDYGYLPTGELALRRVNAQPGGGGGTTYFVDLGFGRLAELDASYHVTSTYVPGPTGAPLARIRGTNVEYFIPGPLGSFEYVVAHGGNLRQQPATNAFGEPIGNPATVDDYGFAQRWRDPLTGLILFDGDAWYWPELGRFIQPNEETGTRSPYQIAAFAPAGRDYPFERAMRPFEDPFDNPMTWRSAFPEPNGDALGHLLRVMPIGSTLVNLPRRYETLRRHHRGVLASGATSVALAVGDFVPFVPVTDAIEFGVGFNTAEGGREFTEPEVTFMAVNAFIGGTIAIRGGIRGLRAPDMPDVDAPMGFLSRRQYADDLAGHKEIEDLFRAQGARYTGPVFGGVDREALLMSRQLAALDDPSVLGKNIGAELSMVDGMIVSQGLVSGRTFMLPGAVPVPEALHVVNGRPQFNLPYRGPRTLGRWGDTEFRALERMFRRTTPASRGVVNIFTERIPCRSCWGAIEEFQRQRPNIEVIVTFLAKGAQIGGTR